MAEHNIYLPAKNSRREDPYTSKQVVVKGDDTVKIYAGFNLEVPNVWALEHLDGVLTTNATVANRLLYIALYDGSSQRILKGFYFDAVTASLSKILTLGNFAYSDVTNMYSDQIIGCLPDVLHIRGQDEIWISVINGVAGDILDLRFSFRFMNWELGMKLPSVWEKWSDW